MIELAFGRQLDEAFLRSVADITNDVGTKRSTPGQGPHHSTTKALKAWAHDTEHRLRGVVPSSELQRLVYTRRYWYVGESNDQLAQIEMEDAYHRWNAELDELKGWQRRWAGEATVVVPDTSVVIRHPGNEFADVNWHAMSGAMKDMAIRVVVPMVVLDELENQKDRGSTKIPDGQKYAASTKARHALRYLAGLFGGHGDPRRPARLGINYVAIAPTVEVLEDPSGPYVRYPRADDELIRRAVMLRVTTSLRVVLLTYDVAMSTRAQIEQLDVVLHGGDDGAVSSFYG